MTTIHVTRAQVLAARIRIRRAQQSGQAINPAWERIANPTTIRTMLRERRQG